MPPRVGLGATVAAYPLSKVGIRKAHTTNQGKEPIRSRLEGGQLTEDLNGETVRHAGDVVYDRVNVVPPRIQAIHFFVSKPTGVKPDAESLKIALVGVHVGKL